MSAQPRRTRRIATVSGRHAGAGLKPYVADSLSVSAVSAFDVVGHYFQMPSCAATRRSGRRDRTCGRRRAGSRADTSGRCRAESRRRARSTCSRRAAGTPSGRGETPRSPGSTPPLRRRRRFRPVVVRPLLRLVFRVDAEVEDVGLRDPHDARRAARRNTPSRRARRRASAAESPSPPCRTRHGPLPSRETSPAAHAAPSHQSFALVHLTTYCPT